MKAAVLSALESHFKEVQAFQKQMKQVKTAQVQKPSDKAVATALCRRWFDEIVPLLKKAGTQPTLVDASSAFFDTFLQLAKKSPGKKKCVELAGSLANYYRKVLIHQVEISPEQTSSALSIAPYIEGLTADEGEYLSEAQRCVSVEGIRAAIVLGWCAAISRIHYKIAEIGFDKFNKASVEMAEKSFGRFKPFNKKFQVDSLSELGRIFDTDLLWVLEYLQLIDGNQHQRLRHCFELRNNSAHPGLAPISGENLYSFYSDITKIVLKNDKFALAPVSSR